MDTRKNLEGLRVLVVEDEFLLADEIAALIVNDGGTVLGPAGHTKAALELLVAGPPPDLAVLDIDLQGKTVYPVAEALATRSVPFLFVTGFGEQAVPPKFAHITRLQKPYSHDILRAELLTLAAP